jgi:hypothetical protein
MSAHVTILTGLFVVALAGCSGDPNALGLGDDPFNPPPGPSPSAEDGGQPDPGPTLTCNQKSEGRTYKGYGGITLDGDRVNEAAGENRARVKPFSVLAGEYTRVIGAPPASLAANATTYGDVPARWYTEAHSSAVELTTSYRIAFDGCLTFTASAAEFSALPTAASAPGECTSMMTKFWSRTPQPSEITSCANYATTALAKEPSARRRWAYVCAAAMTSTRFLTF